MINNGMKENEASFTYGIKIKEPHIFNTDEPPRKTRKELLQRIKGFYKPALHSWTSDTAHSGHYFFFFLLPRRIGDQVMNQNQFSLTDFRLRPNLWWMTESRPIFRKPRLRLGHMLLRLHSNGAILKVWTDNRQNGHTTMFAFANRDANVDPILYFDDDGNDDDDDDDRWWW